MKKYTFKVEFTVTGVAAIKAEHKAIAEQQLLKSLSLNINRQYIDSYFMTDDYGYLWHETLKIKDCIASQEDD